MSDSRTLVVRKSSGTRHPFLRGVVTHDLVQRGLSFDDAYAVARAVRDRLAGRKEIASSELREFIDGEVERLFGRERLGELPTPARVKAQPEVVDASEKAQPFSRGLLARSLAAAGVDLDRAYRLVVDLQAELRRENLETIDHLELARRVGDFLDREESNAVASRYRMVRRIGQLPKPLVIYLAGASGTGKSTLALELAPLLRIYRINATDTIRQVMRMVFSSAILPGIHRSSFEPPDRPNLGGEPGGAAIRRGFEEQATRVCVGVRAVVERALAENMSIIVEGTHLLPPLVPFADLDGSAYQVMLLLSTLDEEVHRSRFIARSRVSGRRAHHYLANLSGIRDVQEYLLEQAEGYEIPILDTGETGTIVSRAMRLLTGSLEQQAPWVAQAVSETRTVPTLYLVVDGMADRPLRALGGRTPLQAAETPTLDRLALQGVCGVADPVAPGVVPDTASGSLALFGQAPMALRRGPVEALGAGLDLQPGDVALRANLATVDDEGRIIDRRAGRIREQTPQLAAALDRLVLPGDLGARVEVRFAASTEHRLALVLRGEGLSSAIIGSDPGDGAPSVEPLMPRPEEEDDDAAVYTAEVLRLVEVEARRILRQSPINDLRRQQGLVEANAVLTRGAGRIHRLSPVSPDGRDISVCCISGDRTLLGLAEWLGAETLSEDVFTANLDTDLRRKFELAVEALDRDDLVVLHVKGADIAAHDRRPDLKVEFLERVDRELGRLLEDFGSPLRVAVAADHATISETGIHAADPVPVLIWGHEVEADEVTAFDELSVAAGRLQRFPLQQLVNRLFAPSP